jgi:hypothetical protein
MGATSGLDNTVSSVYSGLVMCPLRGFRGRVLNIGSGSGLAALRPAFREVLAGLFARERDRVISVRELVFA